MNENASAKLSLEVREIEGKKYFYCPEAQIHTPILFAREGWDEIKVWRSGEVISQGKCEEVGTHGAREVFSGLTEIVTEDRSVLLSANRFQNGDILEFVGVDSVNERLVRYLERAYTNKIRCKQVVAENPQWSFDKVMKYVLKRNRENDPISVPLPPEPRILE